MCIAVTIKTQRSSSGVPTEDEYRAPCPDRMPVVGRHLWFPLNRQNARYRRIIRVLRIPGISGTVRRSPLGSASQGRVTEQPEPESQVEVPLGTPKPARFEGTAFTSELHSAPLYEQTAPARTTATTLNSSLIVRYISVLHASTAGEIRGCSVP